MSLTGGSRPQGYWHVLMGLALLLMACSPQAPAPGRVEQVLRSSWQSYVEHFISPEGRVLVPEREGGTISEAQAYALLRAVWTGDEAAFARVYRWTREHLSRQGSHGDRLLAWEWGRKAGGAWRVLDDNTAADGDLDYALALCMAASRGWRGPPELPGYLDEARGVAGDILKLETVALGNGELLLTPGNWHEAAPPYLLNPSYFSPAAYRFFAQISLSHKNGMKIPPAPLFQRGVQYPPLGKGDLGGFDLLVNQVALTYLEGFGQAGTPAPPQLGGIHQSPSPLRGEGRGGGEWDRLHQDTYRMLGRLAGGLGSRPAVGLFPDWCRVDGDGNPGPAPGRDTDFGWEAVRLPFRVALDAPWFKNEQATRLLKDKFLPFFQQEWRAKGRLAAVYRLDGTEAADYESPVLYAGVLAAALAAGDQEFAGHLARKILTFYQEKDGRAFFVTPDNYYANNWAWLGLALYAGWVKP